MAEEERKKMAIIAAQGSMDMAYPPLILASTAAALDFEVEVFFTFYGLDIIHKKKHKKMKVDPVGQPAMPWPIPNIVKVIPGMTAMSTFMMKRWMGNVGTASIPELLEACQDAEVKFIACEMSMDVMGIKKEQLLDGVTFAGAATFLDFAADADITLYM